jgi:hypothetical protein
MENDKDLDDWLDGLSGKRPPRGAYDEAATLRKVLLREQQEAALDAAQPGPEDSISELKRKRLLHRMQEEGMKLQQQQAAPNRRAWLAAASVAFLALATTLIWQPWQPATQITRGVVGSLRIVNAAPDAEAGRIAAELRQLGLRTTQQGDNQRVRIEVTASTEQLPLLGAWMERRGGAARAAGVYEIIIERGP